MLIIKRLVLYFIISPFIFLRFIPNAIYSIYQILKNHKILKMHNNIVSIGMLGFGNSVQAADHARRFLKGQKTLIVVMNWGFHNPHLGKIWSDLSFLYINTFMNFDTLDKNRILSRSNDMTKMYLDRLILTLIKKFSRAKVYKARELYVESLSLIKQGHKAIKEYLKLHPNGNADLYLSWAVLIKKIKVPRLKYSTEIRNKLYKKLNSHISDDLNLTNTKICCMYNREKGIGTKNSSNHARNGSELNIYNDAISFLIKSGFIILIVGDRAIESGMRKKFGKKLIDSFTVGLDNQLFSLFALTEASIFIGNSGGAAQLPIANETPTLIIDAIPVGIGLTNSYMLFKKIKYNSGASVPDSVLYNDHPYDYTLNGFNIHNNNSEDIANAVKKFLHNIKLKKSGNVKKIKRMGLPRNVLLNYSNSIVLKD